MIRINLLPVQIQAKKKTGISQILIFMGCIMCTLIFIGLVWLHQNNQLNNLKQRSQNLEVKLTKYRRVELTLIDLKKVRNQINQRIHIIKQLQRDRDSLVRILALLTNTIPKGKLWFKKLDQHNQSISIEGVALSNEDICNFMRNLANSLYVGIGHVSLIKSSQKKIEGQKVRFFKLQFNYRTPSQIKQILLLKNNQEE